MAPVVSKLLDTMVTESNFYLDIVSYNMHGFNQGVSTVRDMALSDQKKIFLLQEHWLSPFNLYKFNDNFSEYLCFGSSAMNSCIETGVLRGRPFGGVMTLVHKTLTKHTQIICSDERFVIVVVGHLLIVNVYMPCVGTENRFLIYQEIIENIEFWLDKHPDKQVIIGGDFNVNLGDSNDCCANAIIKFSAEKGFTRCDHLLAGVHYSTYFNESLNRHGNIDYFLTSNCELIRSYKVLDPQLNLSDHRPLEIVCDCFIDTGQNSFSKQDDHGVNNSHVTYLRWDHADLARYHELSGAYLTPLWHDLCKVKDVLGADMVDGFYDRLVYVLSLCAVHSVPRHRKKFYKFWWDQEMNELKEKSITSCKLWKEAGRPRSGAIFNRYRWDKSAYRNGLRQRQRHETEIYTNDLHDALLQKQGTQFWRCWKSKFERGNSNRPILVNGIHDDTVIAANFASHFATTCTPTTVEYEYRVLREGYSGSFHDSMYNFDAELVEIVVSNMSRGKAPGLDGLTAEHLQYSHPLLACILAKLFNAMVRLGHVPASFGQSYTVPLLKNASNAYGKSVTVNDFRGISISPVISKVLEHCILDRYNGLFMTSDNQFGFKKASSCSHAIYVLRCVTDYYVQSGSTVNICAIDVSKAFDKMNHHGLFVKLMKRLIPINLLSLLEHWFSIGMTCVKWNNVWSGWFPLSCGIRQGGVLSPYLFAVYIDNLVSKTQSCGYGCYLGLKCVSILMYADDILLLTPSVSSLHLLFSVCEKELLLLDLSINVQKSVCMRIGARYKASCVPISTQNGGHLPWSDEIRYLGIYVTAGFKFCCSISHAKKTFYRAFNSIFGKIGRIASEETVVHLLKLKCFPCLLYGTEAIPLNKSQLNSLQFAVNSVFRKIFDTKSYVTASECAEYLNCSVVELVNRRKMKFLIKLMNVQNTLCRIFHNNALSALTLLRINIS